MVFNTTFNNIHVVSWRSVLLVEESRVPRENHCPAVLFFCYVVNKDLRQVVSSNPTHGEVYLIQLYVIKCVSDLRQGSGFLWVLWIPPLIKLTATIQHEYC
jgi:hypothetical protein